MLYQYALAIHIIFVVSWMAGLFYIVRLFIYNTEANDKINQEREILQAQFAIMQKKLLNIITTPAMILSVAAGFTMLYLNPYLLQTEWMWVKLIFVLLLLTYHFICIYIHKKMMVGSYFLSSTQLRIWNELATVFLVAIVFTVILKSTIDWLYGLIGLILFSAIILMAVKWYKNIRLKKLK